MSVPPRRDSRQGAVLVWVALLLPVLLGMVGLVIDAGLLMATRRQVQNGVDAAAIAAAKDLHKGRESSHAIATGRKLLRGHRDLRWAEVEILTPPRAGPYAGEAGYVEVVATAKSPTIFMRLLGGVHRTRTARARAVAGSETVEQIDGIIALDHRARAGLAVTGNAHFRVPGRVIVNSEAGGVSEDGLPLADRPHGVAAFVSPFASVEADDVHIVGGVNRADRFQSIEPGGASPLRTGQLPVPDPYRSMPTPTVQTGVLDVHRGAPVATSGQFDLQNPNDDVNNPNRIVTNQETGERTMVLKPGIYDSIEIRGGKVRFEPGIYVVAAAKDEPYAVRILGGDIQAEGVMFYNTRRGYDPVTGGPDRLDGGKPPGGGEPTNSGQIRINANLGFSAIDTRVHDYGTAASGISRFNGMLIYQRRRSKATLQIQGFANDGDLRGVIYAKWAAAKLPAVGVFNTQLVVGSIGVPGHGDLTINYNGDNRTQIRQVFLVE